MKYYTVVGYYDSTGEVGCYHVTARDEVEAVKNLPDTMVSKGLDFYVVSIFSGHLQDLNESSEVSAICDWPGRG